MKAKNVTRKLAVIFPTLMLMLLASVSLQAQTGVLICIEDIPGDSTISGYQDCILADTASITVKSQKSPFCKVTAIYSIGVHSPLLAIQVIQQRVMEGVRVIFFNHLGGGDPVDVPYELELNRFIAKRVTAEAAGESPFREQITWIPHEEATIEITARAFDNQNNLSGIVEETIFCN